MIGKRVLKVQCKMKGTYHSLVVLAFLHELAYLCLSCSFLDFPPLQLNDLHPHVLQIMTLQKINQHVSVILLNAQELVVYLMT